MNEVDSIDRTTNYREANRSRRRRITCPGIVRQCSQLLLSKGIKVIDAEIGYSSLALHFDLGDQLLRWLWYLCLIPARITDEPEREAGISMNGRFPSTELRAQLFYLIHVH